MGQLALSILVNLFWITFLLSILVHLIYPLILALIFALATKKKDAVLKSVPPVSVLLWDDDLDRAQRSLYLILESLLPHNSEIFLLGAAAKIEVDNAPSFVKPLLETEKLDQFTALNIAVTKAAHEVLIIPDPRYSINRYSIRALASFLANSEFDCAISFSNNRPGFLHYSKWITILSENSGISNLSLWSGILAIRKHLWKPISSNRDVVFATAFSILARAGKVGICSQAETKVFEPKQFWGSTVQLSQTMLKEAKELFANPKLLLPLLSARNLLLALVLFRIVFEKIFLWLSPFFMYTAFFANFILALLYMSLKYQIPMLLQIAFYFMALLGHSRWKRGKDDLLVKIFRFVQSAFAIAVMWQNYSKR